MYVCIYTYICTCISIYICVYLYTQMCHTTGMFWSMPQDLPEDFKNLETYGVSI